jgi:glycosyltransferase involved in cell wall biosynthesis
MRPQVGILLGGRWFAFDIARELQRRGALAGVVAGYAAAPRESIGWRKLRWNPLPDLRVRLERRLRPGNEPEQELRAATRFGRWASRHLPECDVLQAWTGYALEAIPRAQARGTTVLATRASSHIRTQAEIVAREYEEYGVQADSVHPAMIERELEEYERADFVQIFSSFALSTFLERGFARERLVLTPVAVDLQEVAGRRTAAPPARGPLRVLYLGQIALRKGIQYLVPAVRRLGPEAVRLSLVGGLAPEGEMLLRRFGAHGEWNGKVGRGALKELFAQHDVLVLPSVEDGFGIVICEAMAAGLPVIATTSTGGPDVIDEGITGLLVPPRSVEALAEALDRLARDRELCARMGEAATEAMRSRRSWQHFADDMLAQYRELPSRKQVLAGPHP